MNLSVNETNFLPLFIYLLSFLSWYPKPSLTKVINNGRFKHFFPPLPHPFLPLMLFPIWSVKSLMTPIFCYDDSRLNRWSNHTGFNVSLQILWSHHGSSQMSRSKLKRKSGVRGVGATRSSSSHMAAIDALDVDFDALLRKYTVRLPITQVYEGRTHGKYKRKLEQ